MILFEPQRVHRIVGRLERGESIPDAFRTIAHERKIATGWITALGAFEWVEVCEYDQPTRSYKPSKRFEGNLEILSLIGNLSTKDREPFLHLHASVSRETDNGIEVLGGHLVRGRVFACEFSLDCFEDLTLQRAQDPATGLFLWAGPSTGITASPAREPAPSPPVSPSTSSGSLASSSSSPTWAEVSSLMADRSRVAGPLPERQRVADHSMFEEPIPEAGDWVDHKQFGLCRVDGEDPDGGLIIRLPNGRRKVIKLDYLEVQAPRLEEGKRVFPLRTRRR